MWVLDTDALTLWFRGNQSLLRHVAARAPEELAVTIITVEEVLSGWYRLIRRAHSWLQQSIEFFRNVHILPFGRSAVQRYRDLRNQHRRAGTNDLRIAAIVLENEATLVSRNVSDFRLITGLVIQDWSS